MKTNFHDSLPCLISYCGLFSENFFFFTVKVVKINYMHLRYFTKAKDVTNFEKIL